MKLLIIIMALLVIPLVSAATIESGVEITTTNATWTFNNEEEIVNLSVGNTWVGFDGDNISLTPNSSGVEINIIDLGFLTNSFSASASSNTNTSYSVSVGNNTYDGIIKYNNVWQVNDSFLIMPSSTNWLYSGFHNLSITVRDIEDNSLLSNVSVLLNGDNVNYAIVVNETSVLENVYTGQYNLIAEKTGYTTVQQSLIIQDLGTHSVTLYLGESSESFVIQVKDVNGVGIEGATVQINRSNDESLISEQNTDYTGSVEFYLTTGITYQISVIADGYVSRTVDFNPITDLSPYTIVLTAQDAVSVGTQTGINYQFIPRSNVLNQNTTYNFTFSINSTVWVLDECTLTIKSDTGITINNTSSDWCSSSTGTSTLTANTSTYQYIIVNASVEQNGTAISYTERYSVRYNYQGDFSLKTLAEDLEDFDKGGFGGQTRFLIAILIIVGVSTLIISKSTFFGEPERALLLITALTAVFSYLGWLTLGFLPTAWLDKWFMLLLMGLVTSATGLIRWGVTN